MNLVKDCIIGILILLLKLQSHWLKKGNTVIAIEHNKQYITEADKIIELGPVWGPKGGYLIKDSTKKKIMYTILLLKRVRMQKNQFVSME